MTATRSPRAESRGHQQALLGLCALLASCTCVRVPDLLYACEADGGCDVPGFRCDVAMQLCVQAVDAGCTRTTCEAANARCGSLSDGCGGTLSCGSCAPGEACGAGALPNHCSPCDAGSPDLPDDEFRDTNCDGLDGDARDAVFVDPTNGDDTSPGTRAAPVRSIGRALMERKAQVLLVSGTYTEDVDLGPTASLYGGYSTLVDGGWVRGTKLATINGTVAARNRTTPLDLDSLEVKSPTPATPGAPSVALTLVDVVQSRVSHCTLSAALGADGMDGAPAPGPADAGESGAPGGCELATFVNGGLGGRACEGGTASDLLSAGGTGGRGGDPSGSTRLEQSGAPGLPAPFGGDGGVPCTTMGCSEQRGANGQPGIMGAAGDAGSPGDELGGISSAGAWTASRGTKGQPGRPGRGGGGGGGGAAWPDGSASYGCSGGGGGAGGCGGEGGEGALGGGASIAMLLHNASPQLHDVTLITAGGGAGGRGGAPASGGEGGAGAKDPLVPGVVGGLGGQGGEGGRGGTGGVGGAAGGGPSVGVWCSGSATITPDAGTVTLGAGGQGGPGAPDGAVRARVDCP
ncbi:MAG: PE-PGRS family protein [Archangium sp.]|nr:PE-PGRS family protein [Archangium sp.]